MKQVGQKDLRSNCLFRFIEVLLEVLHERGSACPHSRGVARVGLLLVVNVAVGIVDVDRAKLYEEIDAGAIGSPEIGGAEFPIADIAR